MSHKLALDHVYVRFMGQFCIINGHYYLQLNKIFYLLLLDFEVFFKEYSYFEHGIIKFIFFLISKESKMEVCDQNKKKI
jgi:hypothetical protein